MTKTTKLEENKGKWTLSTVFHSVGFELGGGFRNTLETLLKKQPVSGPESVLDGMASQNRLTYGFKKSVKVRNVSVEYWPTKKGNYTAWIIKDYSSLDGKRVLRTAPTEAKAREKALSIAKTIANGRSSLDGLTQADALRLASYDKQLAGKGLTLESCIAFALKHSLDMIKPTPVKEAVDKYLTRQLGFVTAKHFRGIKTFLTRFVKVHGEALTHQITVEDVERWVAESMAGLSAKTKNNGLKTTAAFFSWAARNRIVAPGFNPSSGENLQRLDEGENEITIWSAREVQTLLNTLASKGPELLPFFAISVFAGLRSSEIERLTWEQVHQGCKTGWLLLQSKQTKTHRKRIVPVNDTLKAWLSGYSNEKGFVVPRKLIDDMPRVIVAATQLTWRHNAGRHSYASFRFAEAGNIAQVAKELGDTIKNCERHYARPDITPQQAAAYFGIRPQGSGKIIKLAV